VEVLRADAALLRGDGEGALEIVTRAMAAAPPGAHDPLRVRQAARAARRAGDPASALRWLDEWLALEPDGPESGPVWLELAVAAAEAGEPDAADHALERARTLLGPQPVVEKATALLALGRLRKVLA
jgi:Flp pilus assembly protein TadD